MALSWHESVTGYYGSCVMSRHAAFFNIKDFSKYPIYLQHTIYCGKQSPECEFSESEYTASVSVMCCCFSDGK